MDNERVNEIRAAIAKVDATLAAFKALSGDTEDEYQEKRRAGSRYETAAWQVRYNSEKWIRELLAVVDASDELITRLYAMQPDYRHDSRLGDAIALYEQVRNHTG